MSRDYYDILGVSKQANVNEVKKAFRKKAHELHPDKGGDEAAFKEVNEAYQVLGDPQKRATYDRFGRAAFENGAGAQNGFGGFNVNVEDMGDLGDLFGNMFGFGARSSGQKARGSGRGNDIQVRVDLAFMESVKGVEKAVAFRSLMKCGSCHGSGAEDGTKRKTCSACQGSGRVTRVQQTILGAFRAEAVCETCRGVGTVAERACTKCKGNGVIAENRTVSVRFPAGMNDGESIRISGEGEAAPYGGTPGDLYATIRVKSDSRFARVDQDIVSEAFIPLTDCLLGGAVNVETVDGSVELKIPSGTAAGTVFRLRGKGVPYLRNSSRGDHLVTVQPKVEKKLTREQKQVLEQLRDLGL